MPVKRNPILTKPCTIFLSMQNHHQKRKVERTTGHKIHSCDSFPADWSPLGHPQKNFQIHKTRRERLKSGTKTQILKYA